MVDFDRQRRRSDAKDRRRSRSPEGRFTSRQSGTNRVIDPFTMNHHVSFDYFCHWYQMLNVDAPIDDAMQTRYDDYEHDLLARTSRAYVDTHVNAAWFKDLYDGVEHALTLKQGAHSSFNADLEKGTYDTYTLPLVAESSGLEMGKDQQGSISMTGDMMTQVLTLHNIPASLARAALESKIVQHTDTLEHLSISAPRLHDLSRTAWVTLRGNANSTEVRSQLQGTSIEENGQILYTSNISHYRLPGSETRPRTLWAQLNDPQVLQPHGEHLEVIIQQLDLSIFPTSSWPAIKKAKEHDLLGRVDLAIEYLRCVHFFDYWHLRQYDSSLDIQANLAPYARLAPTATSNQRAFEIWQVKFNQKLQLVLHPEQELSRMRVKPVADSVGEKMLATIQQEDENRFRCHVKGCTKLFESVPFVRKHIEKRHGDYVTELTEQEVLFQRYMRDPNKMLPYKQFRELRGGRHHQSSPTRNRRRSPRGGPRHAGHVSHRNGRTEYGGTAMQNYRDLDRPAEDLPELDY